MMGRFLRIAAAVLCTMQTSALSGEIPVLRNGDVPRASVTKTEFYSGESLYGYIDGGADLYLEYGFKQLARQEMVSVGEKIVVEIYQMSDPLHAFGIFSILRAKCSPVDSSAPYSCESKYQLQAVVGECYVSIVNESGSNIARSVSVDVFRALQQKRMPQAIDLPSLFRSPRLKNSLKDVLVAFGVLGIQNGISEWEPLFRSTHSFTLYVLPMEAGTDHASIAQIGFPSSDELLAFGKLAGFRHRIDGKVQKTEVGGLTRFILKSSGDTVLFVESTPSFPLLENLVQSLSAK